MGSDRVGSDRDQVGSHEEPEARRRAARYQEGPTAPVSGDPVVVCDLDGVVWRGRTPVPGAAEGVARLRDAGLRVLFVTNNAASRRDELTERLVRMGIAATRQEVLSSALAAATLLVRRLAPGARVLVAGGPGLAEEVAAAGLAVARTPPADAVVVGLHLDFDYDGLARAVAAVRAGALFVATNLDPTYPVEGGLMPGAGAIVAAVATAAGRTPTVAGKPEAPMAELIRTRASGRGCVVGDRASTDGRLAAALGWPFALVRSGSDDDPDAPGTPGGAGGVAEAVPPAVTGPRLDAVVPWIVARLRVP